MAYVIHRPDAPIITLPQPGESKSQYVPHACRVGNGDLWLVVKGDDSRRIHLHRSQDAGQTFQRQGDLAPTPGAWDSSICSDPVIAFDAANDTVHYYYKGNDDPAAGFDGWAIGHATAPGSNPAAITKDPNNPLLTSEAVFDFFDSAYGLTSLRDLYLSDVVLDPWGLHVFWGGFAGQLGTPYRIFRCRGGWNSFSPRTEGVISPMSPYTHVQAPTVFREVQTGRYVCWFTEGHDNGAAGSLHQVAASCLPDGNWAWERHAGEFLLSAPGRPWDGHKCGIASLLKGGVKQDIPLDVDGAWRLYYSGFPTTAPNTAQSGVADVRRVEVIE